MKYGVIKIAAGVFLGLFAAFVAYKSYEYWELSRLAQAYTEQQTLEAQKLQTRSAAAAKHMQSLTSEQLLRFCGPPLRDDLSSSFRQRYMQYLGADGRRVKIEFVCGSDGGSSGDCYRMGMHSVEEYSSEHPPDYQTYITVNRDMHDSYAAQIKELPCLLGLADLDGGSTKDMRPYMHVKPDR
jgi:hypothetical protein